MGPRCTTVLMDIPLSDDALEALKLGLLPLEMEDKWFIFYEEPNLHFHRSWTGLEAFIVRLESSERGHRIAGITVSQDPETVNFENPDQGVAMAIETIAICMLGEIPEMDDQQPLQHWGSYGRRILGDGPKPGKDATAT